MIENVIQEMISYFQNDVRRINHALKVHSLAHTIGGLEKVPEKEKNVIDLAAVLYDIGIKEAVRKYNRQVSIRKLKGLQLQSKY